jgi:hypothetical protein
VPEETITPSGDSTACLETAESPLSGVQDSGGNMLEWKPRLAVLMVAMASVAMFLGSLVHIGTTGGNFGW